MDQFFKNPGLSHIGRNILEELGSANLTVDARLDTYSIVAWLDFFIIGSNDETCLVVQEKSKNSGL